MMEMVSADGPRPGTNSNYTSLIVEKLLHACEYCGGTNFLFPFPPFAKTQIDKDARTGKQQRVFVIQQLYNGKRTYSHHSVSQFL
ncbi:hypothetical protein CICLE_v10002993mg [Citrus x clementina]|uniref:Uncharacterized protein n=1 Tax=Citrus clementina TaxID=85681 RepID=V4T7C2_CITCL|nr:hypothetical protein CICLE_v10002993mg [Citrus x clementina]